MPSELPELTICVDGRRFAVRQGTSVAAALMNCGIVRFHDSVTGGVRGPLCGMGVCFECTVTINGQSHQRSCQRVVADGMEIATRG